MVEQKNICVYNCCYHTLASLAYILTLLRKFVPLVLLLVFHTEDSLRRLFHLFITLVSLMLVTCVHNLRFTYVITTDTREYHSLMYLPLILMSILIYPTFRLLYYVVIGRVSTAFSVLFFTYLLCLLIPISRRSVSRPALLSERLLPI